MYVKEIHFAASGDFPNSSINDQYSSSSNHGRFMLSVSLNRSENCLES